MDSVTRFAVALGLSIAAAAAAAAPDAPQRGFIIEVPGGLRFERCGSKQPVAVADETPQQALTKAIAAIRPVMSEQDRPIFVELGGKQASGSLVATRLYRAIGHVVDCSSGPTDVPAGALLAAAGIEEPWSFSATAGAAAFGRLNEKPVRFAPAAFARPSAAAGATRVFDAWSQTDGGSIRIEFTESLCLNLAAEAAFGARVSGRLGSRSFEGCASRF